MPTFEVKNAVSTSDLNPFSNDLPTETIFLGNDGDILYGLSTGNKDLGKLSGAVYGLIDTLGTQTTRRGFSKLFNSIALTGTWTTSTSNNIVNGSGGSALSELNANELVLINGKSAKVASVINNNQFTLVNNSYENLAGTTISRIKTVAETLPESYSLLIKSNATITVDYTSGNDSTGNLTNSFSTLQGAINWLSRHTIERTATVTINVNSNCGVRASSPIYFYHPQGRNVKINSLNEGTPVVVSGIVYSDPIVTISTSTNHGLAIGDYVTITGVSPSSYNLFGVVASTPSTTQFTITLTASLTFPAYSSGGVVIKQGNVFTFNNTNGFIVDGDIGELNIAVSQIGNNSGAYKSGILVGGLKEVISTTNHFSGRSSISKGKIFSSNFSFGVLLNHSYISDCDIIATLNRVECYFSEIKNSNIISNVFKVDGIGLYMVSSSLSESTIYINIGKIGIYCVSNSSIFGSTIYCILNTDFSLYLSSSSLFVCNVNFQNSTIGIYGEGSNIYDNTLSYSGNTTDIWAEFGTIFKLNGLTAINHTSNCIFQTFYTTGSDTRVGSCVYS